MEKISNDGSTNTGLTLSDMKNKVKDRNEWKTFAYRLYSKGGVVGILID